MHRRPNAGAIFTTDDNGETDADPAWLPLFWTAADQPPLFIIPPIPDYPSAAAVTSAAAAAVSLASFLPFGDDTSVRRSGPESDMVSVGASQSAEVAMQRLVCAVAGGVLALVSLSYAQPVKTLPYDHIHLNVPDPSLASAWYEKHFGGRRIDEAPDRLMFGSTRFMFLRRADAQPSAGSAIDHVGFSVADLDATMKSLEAAGVKITTPAREVEGLFKLAFVEDPWGTRIEVAQDPELLGLHHIHLRGPEPEQIFAWLLEQFGGERTKLKGRIEAVKYSAPGFSDMWILAQRGEATPSQGHAIDHVGWRSDNLGETVGDLKAKGVTVTSEPRPLPLPNKTTIHFAYVAGPAGARIELVERPGLRPGQ